MHDLTRGPFMTHGHDFPMLSRRPNVHKDDYCVLYLHSMRHLTLFLNLGIDDEFISP